jgi:hypothetical protein
MWRRIKPLEARGRICTDTGSPIELLAYASQATDLLRLMKNELDEKRDTLCIARRLFTLLRNYTAAFLRLYFLTVSETK